jgi:hypothetical protein
MNAAIAFDDLVFACSSLCDLLEIENEALASHDAETVEVLAENKAALARMYESSMEPLIDDPSLAETLLPEQAEELRALGLRLQALVAVNAMRLKAEMECCRRVMDVVVNAVKQNATKTVTYGRKGTFDSGRKETSRSSLSYNKTL